MGKIRAAVFDFDGVILDSMNSVHEAVMKTFSHYGVPHISVQEMCSSITHPLDEWFLSYGIKDSKEKVIETHRNLSKQVYPKWFYKISLIPGVKKVLKEFEKNKIRVYILSSGKSDHVFHFVNHHSIGNFFRHIFTEAYDKDFFLRKIAEINQIQTNEILFVDDWQTGVAHGLMAGCITVGFARKNFTDKAVLQKAGAHFVVSNHRELLELVGYLA